MKEPLWQREADAVPEAAEPSPAVAETQGDYLSAGPPEAPARGEKKQKKQSKAGARIFYWVMFALPLAQFLLCYVAVNFNSILLAFKETFVVRDAQGVQYVSEFVGFDTIWRFLSVELTSKVYTVAVKNSVIYLAFSIAVVIPVGLIFSYYIFKKYRFAEFYRVFLFLPSVICSLIMVIFYSYLVDLSIPEFWQMLTGTRPEGLLTTKATAFGALVFFSFWFSFGPSSLVYVNAMSQIDPSVLEAAELDGAVGLRQFRSVVLPMIFPSITSYIIICVAQVAVNQLNGFSFYGTGASDYEAQTLGYNLFAVLQGAEQNRSYSIAAAGGIVLTLIVAPLTFLVRWLLEKFGPSED